MSTRGINSARAKSFIGVELLNFFRVFAFADTARFRAVAKLGYKKGAYPNGCAKIN
jgi:hypothetical protein